MSNKTQLQTNNTKYASLIETLRGKSIGGEDVTTETNDYTTKLATLETAITALETELEGKASGGSGGGSIETCTVTVEYKHYNPTNVYIFGTQVINGEIQPLFVSIEDGEFTSSCGVTNILKNTQLTIIAHGKVQIEKITTTGCEQIAVLRGCNTVSCNIISSEALITIANAY